MSASQDLEKRYFDWMVDKITIETKIVDPANYTKLLKYLNIRSFDVYILPMDQNRSEDGVDLRYVFGYEQNIDQHEIERYLDRRDCSMLEMMTALAIKAENIVGDSSVGDRTGVWFWSMIQSLGLLWTADDEHYKEAEVIFVLNRFMNHDYKPNGEGGLFIVEDPPHDMRGVEIWNQMCWFLNDHT